MRRSPLAEVDLWQIDRELTPPKPATHSPLPHRSRGSSRQLLQAILSVYLNLGPAEIEFEQDSCSACGAAHGKPRLASRICSPLRFSVAHAGSTSVVAVSLCEVGVDIEHVPSWATYAAVESIACTRAEQRWLAAIRPEQRTAAFARLWVRKEASLKAIGTGLNVDPRECEFDDVELGVRKLDLRARSLLVSDLSLGEGLIGALVLDATCAPPMDQPAIKLFSRQASSTGQSVDLSSEFEDGWVRKQHTQRNGYSELTKHFG
jgi:phosphopantetheinyl transferase